jgi:hypothetical protein
MRIQGFVFYEIWEVGIKSDLICNGASKYNGFWYWKALDRRRRKLESEYAMK